MSTSMKCYWQDFLEYILYLVTANLCFIFLSFQIFFGVVLFGLYHGLVFLPVFLSLLGPQPYPTSMQDHNNSAEEEMCPKQVEEGDVQHDTSKRTSTVIVQNGEPEVCPMLSAYKEVL